METILLWMAAALFAGYLCRLIFIPTIVGFIASGYLFSLYDGSERSLLEIPSEIGVELLLFSIGLNRAITMIAEAKPGRMSSSIIKDLGEHPEDKKPVRIMKGQYGPYIKYKSLNATIPEEKDPTELTMEDALILIEKRKEYDKTKKTKKRKSK